MPKKTKIFNPKIRSIHRWSGCYRSEFPDNQPICFAFWRLCRPRSSGRLDETVRMGCVCIRAGPRIICACGNKTMKTSKIVIITGYSGSGKSTAVSAFEDSDYHCVDNMPVALLPKFLALPNADPAGFTGLAFVMDLREKGFVDSYRTILDSLRQKGYRFEIIFLEASEEVLLRRYSETRRQHPLTGENSLIDSIRTEKKMLSSLRHEAERVINTSGYNVHKLRSVILKMAMEGQKKPPLRMNIFSFGFKHGPPRDADLVMDVRFLPNPYFIPELKAFSGEDSAVRNFILDGAETSRFMDKYLNLLDYLIPLYEKEGKAYLTIAFGCTGGRHRSVAVARAVYDHLQKYGHPLEIKHRDIGR